MAKFPIKAGSTSETIDLFIQDSSKTDGSGLTGLVFNSAGLTCYYNFPRGSSTSVTLATLASTTAAWSSGGFKEIDSTNQPGKYRFDVPNAAIASGNGRYVGMVLRGAANMAPLPLEIELTGWDNQDTVRGGLTALPNAAAEASGGLYTRGTGAGQINQPANGQIDANTVKVSGTVQTARDLGASVLLSSGTSTGQLDFTAGIVKSNLNQVLGGTVPATSITGVPKVDLQDIAGVAVSTSTAQLGVNAVNIGGTAAASAAIGSVGSVSGAVASVTARVTANTDQWAGTTIPAPTVTGVPKVDLVDIAGSTVSTSSAQLGVNAVQIGAVVPGSATIGTVTTTTTATNLTNAPTSGDFTAAMKTSLNAATPSVTLSVLESPILESGTAQAGAASEITLRSGASATDDLYRGLMLRIYGGSGAGQARVITGYVGSTKVATVDNAWVTSPSSSSTYAIVGHEAAQVDATGSVKIQIPLKANAPTTNFPIEMYDSNGNLASGLGVTAQKSIDGAAFIACVNAVRELGGGRYLIDLDAADLNGTSIGLRFTATGAKTRDVDIFAVP